jgi:hypothetical protein
LYLVNTLLKALTEIRMINKLLSTFLILICAITLLAQESDLSDLKTSKSNEFAVGGLASTNGLGLNVIYSLTDKVAIRGGYERLSFNFGFEFNEDEINYDATLDYKTGSFSVLADYYLLRHLYCTGGFGLNRFNPRVHGYAVSDLKYGDIYISPEKIGTFDFSVEPGLKISPYVGLGFGRNIGLDKKVAFNFELGTYYIGNPDVTIQTTGLLLPTSDPVHKQKELFEKQLESYRFYPVIKFGISVKLF